MGKLDHITYDVLYKVVSNISYGMQVIKMTGMRQMMRWVVGLFRVLSQS